MVRHTLYLTTFQNCNKMDIIWDDNGDLIDLVTMLFFTPGGDFTLENEVLQPSWGGGRRTTCGLGRISSMIGMPFARLGPTRWTGGAASSTKSLLLTGESILQPR